METLRSVELWKCECGLSLKAVLNVPAKKKKDNVQVTRAICPVCRKETPVVGELLQLSYRTRTDSAWLNSGR
jgi:hypothetical protein